MIDLIKEIEDNQFDYAYDDFRKGYNAGLNIAIKTFDQYNIITAPKTIKLSEIVTKAKKTFTNEDIYFNKENNTIGFGEWDKDWRQNTWYPIVRFNKNMEIAYIPVPLYNYTKWLYTLWIAGTIIEDDLKEE